MMQTSEPWLTVKEAAALLKVCRDTIYRLVERGELVHVRVGNVIRIRIPKI
jgi:excisionase family DNA binding protein